MIKIALISPKGPLYKHKTGIFRKDLRVSPLTLTTLAALVPKDIPTSIHIYDEGVEDLPNNLDADLIGMTVITGSAPRSYELSRRFRAEGKTVILGGPHITLVPEDAAPHADSIVIGYAEETWPQLIRDYSNGELKSEYRMSPTFSLKKPENLPFPARHLLKGKSFKSTSTFEATRGCRHKCEFCVVPSAWGRNPYQKPISHIIDDIRQKNSKKILFYDLNLFADFNYVKELLTALVPLKLKWFGLSTVLIGKDPELVELTARSGCLGLLIGFETLSNQSLNEYGKKFNEPAYYAELIRSLHSYNIAVNGELFVGSDGDRMEDFDKVRDFVIKHKIDLPRFSILTPFPGTPLYKRLELENRIFTKDWSLYDGQHVVFHPRNLTADQLMQQHEKIWKDVYKFGNIATRLRFNFDSFPIVFGANLAYRFYANNLSRFYTCIGGMI